MGWFARINRIVSVFSLLFLVSAVIAPSEAVDVPTYQQRTWAKTYGGFSLDTFWSVRQTTDGGFVLSGESGSFSLGTWVVKLDAVGNPVWQNTIGGCEGSHGVLEASDGGFVVSGESSFSFRTDSTCIARVDGVGRMLWQKAYSGAGVDEAFSLEGTSDGGFIVVGLTEGDISPDAFALRVDSNGNVVWQRTYGGPGWDWFTTVKQISDGGFIVAGETTSFGAGDFDAWAVRLDALGNIVWQKAYGASGTDRIFSIQPISDGSFMAAGDSNSFGAGLFDAWTLHLDSNGNILWRKAYGGTFNDQGVSLTATRDGAFLIAGVTGCQGAGCLDAWFVKINRRGEVLWQTSYGGPLFDAIFSLEETNDGGFIAAGHTKSFGVPGEESSGDGWVLRLDQRGGHRTMSSGGSAENVCFRYEFHDHYHTGCHR